MKAQRPLRPGRVLPLCLTVVLWWPAPVSARTPEPGTAVTCRESQVQVALAPGRPADQAVATKLCGPEPLEGRVLHVLISGATYGALAWDFPLRPERYSYVRALTRAGVATLNLDRLGIGASSHPDSSDVDIESHIFIYHQLLSAARSGALGVAFDKVVVVGHSYGSVIAYGVGNRYPAQVDGVIITGLQHEFDPAFMREFWGQLHPANEEGGRFAGLDSGYLTSRPGQRHLYYRSEATDPDVIAFDEATKETFTMPDARTFPPVMAESKGIRAPVLDVIGEYDRWFCAGQPCSGPNSTASRSRGSYADQICFEQFVIPGAGHDVNVHHESHRWFAVAAEWTNRVVAAGGPCRTDGP
jgi:pimeloyl-ACP methyl ester carboxylesterase